MFNDMFFERDFLFKTEPRHGRCPTVWLSVVTSVAGSGDIGFEPGASLPPLSNTHIVS